MTLDPRALRTFLAVCREGSISGAARRLNVTQPAVSATISQLEQYLQTSLFARARSGISLTPPGVALRRRAEALDALLDQAEREVSLAKVSVAGPLVIGGTPGALASLVPQAVARVRRQHPGFQLQVLERGDSELSELLRHGRIDIAVVTTGIIPQTDDLIEESILTDPFSLIVGRENHRLPKALPLSSLSAARWVLPDAVGAFRRQLDALFIATDTPAPADVIRCDSLLTTKAIVRETDYVTILPREVAAAELSIGVLRDIAIQGAFLRNVGLRYLAGVTFSPFAAAFLEALRAHPGGAAAAAQGGGGNGRSKNKAYGSKNNH